MVASQPSHFPAPALQARPGTIDDLLKVVPKVTKSSHSLRMLNPSQSQSQYGSEYPPPDPSSRARELS